MSIKGSGEVSGVKQSLQASMELTNKNVARAHEDPSRKPIRFVNDSISQQVYQFFPNFKMTKHVVSKINDLEEA